MNDSIAHKGSKRRLLGENPTKSRINEYSNEKQIDSLTPTTFLVHATNDISVPVENSIGYYLALKKHNVSAELHIYKDGKHGFGLGTDGTNQNWTKHCEAWLRANKFIDN